MVSPLCYPFSYSAGQLTLFLAEKLRHSVELQRWKWKEMSGENCSALVMKKCDGATNAASTNLWHAKERSFLLLLPGEGRFEVPSVSFLPPYYCPRSFSSCQSALVLWFWPLLSPFCVICNMRLSSWRTRRKELSLTTSPHFDFSLLSPPGETSHDKAISAVASATAAAWEGEATIGPPRKQFSRRHDIAQSAEEERRRSKGQQRAKALLQISLHSSPFPRAGARMARRTPTTSPSLSQILIVTYASSRQREQAN